VKVTENKNVKLSDDGRTCHNTIRYDRRD